MNALTEIDIAHARLPATYEAAKAALAECTKIDECVDWSDKAAALASYARQSDDMTLFNYAKRIQGRAVRRSGELLKQFDGRPQNAAKQTDGGDSLLSQRDAAGAAGMSERQQVTAVRVANIPEPDFNEAIEAETPPTITALAEMGTTPRPRPDGWREATALLGEFQRFAEFCEKSDPTTVARGVLPHEIGRLEKDVATADAWLDTFIVTLNNKEHAA